jgi:hypothetical protein
MLKQDTLAWKPVNPREGQRPLVLSAFAGS